MMSFFSNRSIRWKLIVILIVLNFSVLLLVAGGIFIYTSWFSKPEMMIDGRDWNALALIFSVVFFIGLLLSLGLQRLISKRVQDLAVLIRSSALEGDDTPSRIKDEFVLFHAGYEEIQKRLQKKEMASNTSETRYALAGLGAHDGLWHWDLKTDQIYFSPRWQALLGYEAGEIGSEPSEWFERIYPEDFLSVQHAITAHLNGKTPYFEQVFRIQHKEAGCRWMRSRALLIRDKDGSPAYLGGSQSDITTQKLTERTLVHDAAHDVLTGLLNRTIFLELLTQALKRRQNKGYKFAVFFLDLDHFKVVNDSLGYMVGDQVLIGVAHRLKKCVREQDAVSRLGGDAFALLVDDIALPDHAGLVLERIQKSLKQPFQLGKEKIELTSSIGILTKTSGYRNAEDLLRDAHIAMKEAKSSGPGQQQVFEINMHQQIVERISLEKDLKTALKNEEFEIYYQAIVSFATGKICAFEALIRWNHPEKGFLQPGAFIPLAEDTGLIVPMDRWVLRKACHQVGLWQKMYPQMPRLKVSVNMSGKQFVDLNLIEEIDHLLEKTGFLADDLHIEITETVIMNNFDIAQTVLQALKTRGVQLSMDDFGTGYSSLSYLNRFPFHTIKIDRSFISKISEGGQQEITKAIISLAEDLGMKVVAEGIETRAQLKILRALKCGYGQGFLFSKPLSRKAAEALLSENQVMVGFQEVPASDILGVPAPEAA